MILVIDNYDSFVWNLVQAVRALGHEVLVRRNDALTVREAVSLEPERILISPGPRAPRDAGISVALVRAAAEAGIPLLGVCLGHQCIGEAFGGRVVRARHPLHGEASPIRHDGETIFEGVPSPFLAARYHSLAVAKRLPRVLEATAWTEDGTLMGLRHRERPIEGVQFHPESFLTESGARIIENFVGRISSGERGARVRSPVRRPR